MKHQTVPKRSLPQAIELQEELDSYLETITEKALSHSNDVNDTSTGKPSGPQGTISNQTKGSVNMILNGLKDMEASQLICTPVLQFRLKTSTQLVISRTSFLPFCCTHRIWQIPYTKALSVWCPGVPTTSRTINPIIPCYARALN